MSLIPIARWGVALCIIWSAGVFADCIRTNTPAVDIDMSIGRVVVSPDAPVGTVLATRTWNMPSNGQYYYTCTRGNYEFNAQVVAQGVVEGADKIFSTNVPGIGLRFSRGGDTVNIVYPGSYTVRATSNNTSIYLEGSHFTLEVIKTASTTGSGTLASGQYTSYGWKSNPILITRLSGNAITIVSPSCTVLSGKNMNVDIGTIKRTDLKGVGTWAGGTPFNIQLQCSGGVSASGFANINTTFSGNLATNTSASQGVLINEKTGSSAAKGIGVQVLKDGTPLELDKKYFIGQLATSQTSFYTLPYTARFYQYLSDISSGEVQSHMVFNLTYD